MRAPSVNTLKTVFDSDAIAARKLLKMPYSELVQVNNAAITRLRECYHAPLKCDVRLSALNSLGHSFGVELIATNKGDLWYLNTGDLYSPTLIFFCGNYRIANIGDMIERGTIKTK